ncbi:hypothetical protein M9458_033602, partial [Cirrhinus mrigala]
LWLTDAGRLIRQENIRREERPSCTADPKLGLKSREKREEKLSLLLDPQQPSCSYT